MVRTQCGTGQIHVEVTSLRKTCGKSCESRDDYFMVSFRVSTNQKLRYHLRHHLRQPTPIWPDLKILPNEKLAKNINKLQCSRKMSCRNVCNKLAIHIIVATLFCNYYHIGIIMNQKILKLGPGQDGWWDETSNERLCQGSILCL